MYSFLRATLIRCARTFLTTILGVWTAGTLITDVDWETTLMSAFSATIYILILCLVKGLPEVEMEQHIYMNMEEPTDSEVEEDEE